MIFTLPIDSSRSLGTHESERSSVRDPARVQPNSVSSSTPDAAARALHDLLESLGLNDETLATLRTALSPLLSSSASPLQVIKLSDPLIQLFKQHGIPVASEQIRPEELVKQIGASPERLISIIAAVIHGRERADSSNANGAAVATARRILQELDNLGILPGSPPDTSGSDTRTGIEDLKEEIARELKLRAPLLERAISALERKGPLDASAQEALKGLRAVIGSQLESLSAFEGRVKLLLNANGSSNTLSDLITLLDTIRKATENGVSPAEEALNKFVRELLKGIQGALQQQPGSEGLKRILEGALERLKQEFSSILVPPDGSSPPEESIPKQVRSAAKLVETQIVSLLTNGDLEGEISELQAHQQERIFTILGTVRKGITQLLNDLDGEKTPAAQLLRRTILEATKVIGEVIENRKPAHSLEQVRAMLKELVSQLRSFNHDVVSDTLPEPFFPPPAGFVQRLESELVKVLEPILNTERGIQKVLRGVIPRELFRPGGGSLDNLSLLLRQMLFELPATGTAAEEELSRDVATLVDDLEKLQAPPASVKEWPVKERLARLLPRLGTYIETSAPSESGAPELGLVDTETLKAAGSVLAAQETLQRMVPMMKALGEPALILFPFIFGNLLVSAQVTLYPSPQNKDDTRRNHGEQSPELFERFRVVVTLPKLGRIMVDVAIRTGEVLMNLGFESTQSLEQVEDKLPVLRRALSAAGLQSIEINCSVVDFAGRDLAGVGPEFLQGTLEKSMTRVS